MRPVLVAAVLLPSGIVDGRRNKHKIIDDRLPTREAVGFQSGRIEADMLVYVTDRGVGGGCGAGMFGNVNRKTDAAAMEWFQSHSGGPSSVGKSFLCGKMVLVCFDLVVCFFF